MRHLLFASALLAALSASAGVQAAPAFQDPKALLDYAYAPYSSGKFPDDPEELYSSHLKALVAESAARTPKDEVGPLDFDPFINAQDYEIKKLAIGTPQVAGDHADVQVKFANFDVNETLMFHLLKEADGWKIDDIQSLTPDLQWKLSEILTQAQ